MRILKLISKIFLAVLIALLLVIVVVIVRDNYETNYLNIDGNKNFTNSSYLIQNVNVIPMTHDTVLYNKTVLINRGIIEKISDKFKTDNVEVIDAKGMYLSPGLIDMHVHVWDKYELGLYLANGVTAVRNLWGMPMHLRLKDDINEDEIISPLFYTSGPKLTGREFIGDDNLNLKTTEEARKKIISYKKRGYDFIKTYYGLEKDLFDAILDEAINYEIDIVAHPSQKLPFSYHLKEQIKSIEHAEEIVQQPLQFDLDTVKLKTIIDSIASSKNTSYCPTLTVFENIYQMMINDSILTSDELNYMNTLIRKTDSENQFYRWYNAKKDDPETIKRIKNQHDFHLKIVEELHKAGVNIICGSDAGIGVTIPGFSIHKELAFYKLAGLSNFEALKTATVNAANTHSIMNSMGSVEEGKIANLLLLENNPLSDLSTLQNPEFIFIKGRKIDREAQEEFREKAKNKNNLIISILRYLENLLIEKI